MRADELLDSIRDLAKHSLDLLPKGEGFVQLNLKAILSELELLRAEMSAPKKKSNMYESLKWLKY